MCRSFRFRWCFNASLPPTHYMRIFVSARSGGTRRSEGSPSHEISNAERAPTRLGEKRMSFAARDVNTRSRYRSASREEEEDRRTARYHRRRRCSSHLPRARARGAGSSKSPLAAQSTDHGSGTLTSDRSEPESALAHLAGEPEGSDAGATPLRRRDPRGGVACHEGRRDRQRRSEDAASLVPRRRQQTDGRRRPSLSVPTRGWTPGSRARLFERRVAGNKRRRHRRRPTSVKGRRRGLVCHVPGLLAVKTRAA